MKKFLIGLAFCSVWAYFLYVPLVIGYDLPKINVEKAFKNGKAAFIARVIRLEEIQRQDAQTIVEAKLEIIDCFYGLECRKTQFIKMRYVSETVVDGAFPVEFEISSEVFIILSRPILSLEITFVSNYKDGFDAAFVIGDTFPKKYYQSDTLRLFNIYHPKSASSVSKKDIDRWNKERERIQKGKNSGP